MDAGRLSLMCLRIATSREEKAQRRRHGWGRAYLWHVPHPIFDFMTRERLFPLDNLRFPSIIISIYMIRMAYTGPRLKRESPKFECLMA